MIMRARLPQDEVIYCLARPVRNGDPKNDLGGLKGDRLATGYDPTHKAIITGETLGPTKRLDYIQGWA